MLTLRLHTEMHTLVSFRTFHSRNINFESREYLIYWARLCVAQTVLLSKSAQPYTEYVHACSIY